MKSLDIPLTVTKIDYITISFVCGRAIGRLNRSSIHTVTIPYSSFANKLGAIHRAGGKVISVSTPHTHAVRSEVTQLPEVNLEATIAEPIAEPMTEAIAEVVSEVIPETVIESATEPEIESVTESISEIVETSGAIAEPVVEPVIEPVLEPVAAIIPETEIEPVVEPAIEEPVTEQVIEAVAEKVIEPVIEPVVELASEPEPSVKSKKPRASSKSGGFAKPKVDTAPAKATRSPRKPKS